MKAGDYLFFIRRVFKVNPGLRWLNIVSAAFAFSLILISTIFVQTQIYCRNSACNSISTDLLSSGMMSNHDGYSNERYQDYMTAIYDSPEIDAVGYWTYGASVHMDTEDLPGDPWNEILSIQNRNVRQFNEFEGSEEYVQVVSMERYAFRFSNIKLLSGIDETDMNNEYLIYLGYNFRNIPVGVRFVEPKTKTIFKVAGIMEKGSSILYMDAFSQHSGGFHFGVTVPMDNMVLFAMPAVEPYITMSSVNFFSCAKGYSFEEAERRIKALSSEYGISYSVETMEKRLDTVLNSANWAVNGFKTQAILFMLIFSIILIASDLILILSRKDEIGVMTISGVSRRKIFIILFLEDFLCLLISSAISVVVAQIVQKTGLELASYEYYNLRYIIFVNSPIMVIAISAIVSLLASGAALLYLKHKSLPDIVRGNLD